jgi:hypothetical protein
MQFQEEWFQIDNDATPDGSDVAAEIEFMKKPVA